MQQRYYDPLIGRFYSNDPVGFTASNPMMFNRYAYANNNPYKFVDPDGNEPISFAPLHPFAQERQIFNDGARLASGAATAAPGFAAEIAVGTTKFVFKHILTPSNISFAAGLFPGVGPFVVSTTFAIVDSVDSETFSNLGGIMAGEIMEKTMETYGKKYPKTAFCHRQCKTDPLATI